VRATLIAIGALAAALVAAGCTSTKCYPDCAAGYEPVPDACACRPIADAATSGDGGQDAADPTARKRVFHLMNGALGAIRDANDPRTGLEVADADCTTAGQMYGGGSWRAWLSDSSTNAIDRLSDVGPWYRLDQQTKLFADRAALTQGPLGPIEDPTDANAGIRSQFWSGTLLDGTASTGNCTDWTSYVGGGTATVGRTDTAGSGWVDPTPLSCSKYLSLLCFEQ
jgi:hypothetical protein